MKQPILGIAATLLVMAIALGFISAFPAPTFMGWVAYAIICMIPTEVVMGVIWGMSQPSAAVGMKQPLRGIVHVLFTAAIGVVVLGATWTLQGASVSPPPPMLAMSGVTVVALTFFLTIVWGGWPIAGLIKNKLASGLAILVAAYLLNALQFKIFFNFEFMKGAPVYVPSLDPHGLFNAWSANVFIVTSLVGLFALLHFDLWPLNKFPAIMKQPVLGTVWTLGSMVLAAGMMSIGLGFGMDVVDFMVGVPIPFIFGTIVVLNMLRGSLFAKLEQPGKGIASVLTAVVVGQLLAFFYTKMMPVVSGPLNLGPPGYDAELWLASALLAVTFPFLIFYADYFQMWPLDKPSDDKR